MPSSAESKAAAPGVASDLGDAVSHSIQDQAIADQDQQRAESAAAERVDSGSFASTSAAAAAAPSPGPAQPGRLKFSSYAAQRAASAASASPPVRNTDWLPAQSSLSDQPSPAAYAQEQTPAMQSDTTLQQPSWMHDQQGSPPQSPPYQEPSIFETLSPVTPEQQVSAGAMGIAQPPSQHHGPAANGVRQGQSVAEAASASDSPHLPVADSSLQSLKGRTIADFAKRKPAGVTPSVAQKAAPLAPEVQKALDQRIADAAQSQVGTTCKTACIVFLS